ncbi:unnamed protein product [Rangifer tarandus platyrhynchus]|uniref:Uncharacterized protein n=1 Tax=Rangifer tarandus platyrhynchus TaxID=3082113 RepID=A0ABN8YV73_RANTA|nr:unnamed protein product [Rangifer tarandus platyrhynchus]
MILLKPNPINHHLVVFFFISKTFIEPLSTDTQRDQSHRMYLGKLPGPRHRPTQKSHGRADLGLTSAARTLGASQGAACSHPGLGFVWLEGWREGLEGSASGPSDHLHVNSQTKAPPTRPLSTQTLGLVLLSLHGAWKPLACQQASGKLVLRDLSPSSRVLSLGGRSASSASCKAGNNVEGPEAEERVPPAWSQNARGEAGTALRGGGEEASAWCWQRGTLAEVWDLEPRGPGVDTDTNWGTPQDHTRVYPVSSAAFALARDDLCPTMSALKRGSPGQNSPHGPALRPSAVLEGVREGTRLQAGPSQVRSLRSRPQARGRRGPLATRGDCPLTPQDCRVSAPGTPGDPCSPHTHTPTTTTTFYKLFQLTGARGRGRAKARKFSAPSPKLSVLGKQLKESDKGGTRGRTPPPPGSGDGFPGGRRKGGIALGLGVFPKQTAIRGSPHPRHRPPRIRALPPAPRREEGRRPSEKERSGKDPARSPSTFLSAPQGLVLATGGEATGLGNINQNESKQSYAHQGRGLSVMDLASKLA